MISVIIPVKDEINLLLNCIETLNGQGGDYISEIIIIENGSQNFRQFSFNNPLIRYFYLPNGNRSVARNFGVSFAKSELIAFLDADTELESGWLKEVALSFEATTLAVTGPIVPSAKQDNLLQAIRLGRALERTNKTFISVFKVNRNRIVLNSAAFAIRKELFNQLGGFDPELFRHEDLDFTQRLLKLEGNIIIIKTPQVRVYFNGGIFKYLRREFYQSCSLVRYHEKWTSSSWSISFSALIRNIKAWYRTRENLFELHELDRFEYFISLIFLAGNVAGLIYRITSPYQGKKQNPDLKRRAQIIFK